MADATGTARRRPVRSYVRREGRLTPGQQRALAELLPRYGIDYTASPLDLARTFGRDAPCVMEIGFGNGDTLLAIAERRPEANLLGVEVHRPGVGHLLRELDKHELANVRVICHDAVDVLRDMIPPGALAAVNLFFPDPWPKKRHHKRRIVQPAFVALVAERLARGGVLHMATDWENYAQHMLETVSSTAAFENLSGHGGYIERPSARPVTKFERRGRRLGHGTWDLMFRRR